MDEGDSVKQADLRDEFLHTSWNQVSLDGPSPWEAYLEQVGSVIESGFIILDIGAGTAHVLASLIGRSSQNFIPIGLDISQGMISKAKKNLTPNPRLIRGDAKRLPISDRSINLVLSRLAKYDKTECYRTLKNQGFLFIVATGKNDWKEIREGFDQFEERVETDHAANLRIAGFKDIIEETFSYHEYYPFEAMVDVVEFVPIVERFTRKKHLPKLRSIADKHRSEKGVKITRAVRIIRAQKTRHTAMLTER